MSKKDQSTMTLQGAVEWAERQTQFADVRKRLASRQASFLLLNALKDAYLKNKMQNDVIKEMQEFVQHLGFIIGKYPEVLSTLRADPDCIKLGLFNEHNETAESTSPTSGRTEEETQHPT